MNLRPDRSTRTVPFLEKGRVKARKLMTFEVALGHLRRGKNVRRVIWHDESLIFRLGDDVYIKLPAKFGEGQQRPGAGALYGSRPDFWKPYPSDVLAKDWVVA